MNCQACGGELFEFVASNLGKGLVASKDLPTACRRCGQLVVNGQVVPFPAGMAEKVATMAEEAAAHGKDTREKMLLDPQVRIENYFANVYKTGYIDGWLKAAVYFHTNLKEGRIRRLRDLWKQSTLTDEDSSVVLQMSLEAYREFKLLLTMGTQDESTSDTGTTGKPSGS